MDVIYYPSINEYNGKRTVQIVVRNWRFKGCDKNCGVRKKRQQKPVLRERTLRSATPETQAFT